MSARRAADPDPDRDPDREQEHSIRRRKQLLFDAEELAPGADDGAADRQSFAEYLRTTPAAPLSPTVKAMLWAAGVVVALLLVGALYKASQPRPGRPGTAPEKNSGRSR